MAETAENNLDSPESKGIIKRNEKGHFLPGNPPGPGWKNRNEEASKLAKLRDELLDGSEEAIAVLREILKTGDKDTVKVSAAKILIQCAKIIPDQVFHESWKMILNKSDGGQLHGLLTALPEFGNFLQWKQKQDSGSVIDVKPEQIEGNNVNK
jgi:hypothetical protein